MRMSFCSYGTVVSAVRVDDAVRGARSPDVEVRGVRDAGRGVLVRRSGRARGPLSVRGPRRGEPNVTDSGLAVREARG